MDVIVVEFYSGKYKNVLSNLKKSSDNTDHLKGEDYFVYQNASIATCYLVSTEPQPECASNFLSLLYELTAVQEISKNDIELELTIFRSYLLCVLDGMSDFKNCDAKIEHLLKHTNFLVDIAQKSKQDAHLIEEMCTFGSILQKVENLLNNISKWSAIEVYLLLDIIQFLFLIILSVKYSYINYMHQVQTLLCTVTSSVKYKLEVMNLGVSVKPNKYLKINFNWEKSLENFVTVGCLFLLKNKHYEEIVKIIENNKSDTNAIFCYLSAYIFSVKNRKTVPEGFLLLLNDEIIDKCILVRKLILQGLLCSKENQCEDSINYLKKAVSCDRKCVPGYYYLSREYSKLGLFDLMLETLEEMLQILKAEDRMEDMINFNFNKRVLEIIHPIDEITLEEGLYALASGYGLCERFDSSNELYNLLTQDDVLNKIDKLKREDEERIIAVPDRITILHESITVKILVGELSKAEEICIQCCNNYGNNITYSNLNNEPIFYAKNDSWILALINKELCLEQHRVVGDRGKEILLFFENYLSELKEDVISLMLQLEILKIILPERWEEYRDLLTKILLLFSKHISMYQKLESSDKHKLRLTLVKALVAKVCISIANCQVEVGSFVEAEKMFKRALSCNHGDKDVLFDYFNFLQSQGKLNDARNLWKTFFNSKNTVNIEHCQSLSLKFLLRTKISKDELEKIEFEVGIIS